jgi:hypothetical protein
MGHIFISYSHKDKAYVDKLQKYLLKQGFDAWIDDRIDYGTRWPREIEKRLKDCEAFILIMSTNSYESEWVQNELSFARQLKKPIFPLLLDGVVWWHLQTTQYVDVKKGKLPPAKFFVRLSEFTRRDEIDSLLGDATKEPDDMLPLVDDLITEKEKRALELNKLESQAIQYELRGDFWNARKIWYEIKRIDPSYPRVDIKIDELERELRQEKEKHEAAKKALHEKAERERVERRTVWKAKIQKTFTKSLATLKTTLIQAKPVFIIIGVMAIITLGYIFYDRVANPPLLFFCTSANETYTCEYTKKSNETIVIPTLDDAINWSPVLTYDGYLYFTSNRDGKAEIYYLNLKDKNAEAKRVTHTEDPYESWSPALTYDGYLYFTSNQDGKAEIYYLNLKDENSKAKRVTYTEDPYESWSPVVRGQNIYFTSNSTGRNEVYIVTFPQSSSISNIESWTGINDKIPLY